MSIVITNDKRFANSDVFIKNTHRGLWYEDGVLVRVLDAGRHIIPGKAKLLGRRPRVEVVLVDVRERELTIKGQEILTSDKVAIRVSIVVQFRVTDPAAALQNVAEYEDRLYSDVQLAARRSLASMTLEDILTNRTRLSEDILNEVLAVAAGYGVAILRADVKDLIFPGNLQDIMNRVLATERLSEAQLVEARTKAETQRIEAVAKAEARGVEATAEVERQRLAAEADAEAERIRTTAEVEAARQREQVAQIFTSNPALLRLRELETLRDLSQVANARIYIGFPKHVGPELNGVSVDHE
jgi:regulator of protease activity HflC (stomatin/prohibitin superfamily)